METGFVQYAGRFVCDGSIAYYLAWKKLSKQLRSRLSSDQVGGPVLFEIWVVNKFEEFPGDSFFPSAKVSLFAPCSYKRGATRYHRQTQFPFSFQGIAGSLLRHFTNRSRLKGSFFLGRKNLR